MNQAQQQFVRTPGDGRLFWKHTQPDVKARDKTKHRFAVFDGWLALPGGKSVQVVAVASSRLKTYALTLREFPETASTPDDAWKELAQFELPAFEGMPYVEGEFKLGTRTYKVRMFKDSDGNVRLRLPQVSRTPAEAVI